MSAAPWRSSWIRGSLLFAVLLSGLATVLDWQTHATSGLNRVVFQAPGLSGRIIDRATTHAVDLEFLEQDPTLPRRLFSIRWDGFLHIAESGVYVLFLGADDRARVRIDGQLVHERSPTLGMDTTPASVPLTAGLHTIDVEFEQDRGGRHLNLAWALAGQPPAPLNPFALFPTAPSIGTVRGRQIAQTLRRASRLVWLVWLGVVSFLVGVHVWRSDRFQTGGWRPTWADIAGRSRRVLLLLQANASTVAAGGMVLIVCYAASLRGDALVSRYGPLEEPGWARAFQSMGDYAAHLRPRALGWRPVDQPYVGGDPINYIRFARDMDSFYGAHVREPVFPFVTKVFLTLLNQQNVAVSFASAFFSTLSVWATWLLGSYAFSRWVGLGAALAMAVERDAISWGVNGWRDDAFTFFVVLSAYALLRCHRNMTVTNAGLAGVVAGLACLTRITSISFLMPAFALLAVAHRASDTRKLAVTLGLAVTTMTMVTAPYLINCWREFGDPFYAINDHTEFYQIRQGDHPEPELSAAGYVTTMVADRPLETLETMVVGLTVYPFTNKWNGYERWVQGLGRWLSWSALAGLGLMLGSASGRFLVMVFAASLLPYAFTWNIPGGGEWRFTQHVYPLYLIAACVTLPYAKHALVMTLRPWRTRSTTGLTDHRT